MTDEPLGACMRMCGICGTGGPRLDDPVLQAGVIQRFRQEMIILRRGAAVRGDRHRRNGSWQSHNAARVYNEENLKIQRANLKMGLHAELCRLYCVERAIDCGRTIERERAIEREGTMTLTMSQRPGRDR